MPVAKISRSMRSWVKFRLAEGSQPNTLKSSIGIKEGQEAVESLEMPDRVFAGAPDHQRFTWLKQPEVEQEQKANDDDS
jgi:hypothetical protein